MGEQQTGLATSPGPTAKHQKFVSKLSQDLSNFLEGKPCEPYVSPIDVYLSDGEANGDTVVQPDVVVICDQSKLVDEGVRGAPDFVVEVLSDSTALKDLDIKKTCTKAMASVNIGQSAPMVRFLPGSWPMAALVRPANSGRTWM